MKELIPLSVPFITPTANKYVQECIKSGWVSSVGTFVTDFEKKTATFAGVKHAVATTNGTAALHLALICCGLSEGHEVIVPALSFVATVNPIRYCRAFPVFFDVDPHNWTLDVHLVENFLSKECHFSAGRLINKSSGREIAGIVPVHLYGHPADLEFLGDLCERYGLFMVEDGAESIGSSYKGKVLGSFKEFGIISFNGNKTITTGAGGMLLTNNDKLANLARHLSTQAKVDPVSYIHDEIGYNYRMSNLSAALGLSQIEELNKFIDKKTRIAKYYRSKLSGLVEEGMITFQRIEEWATSNYWLNCIVCSPKLSAPSTYQNSWSYLVDKLAKRGIQTRPFWYPLHLLKPFAASQFVGTDAVISLCNNGVCLPSSVGLTETQQDKVIAELEIILNSMNKSNE